MDRGQLRRDDPDKAARVLMRLTTSGCHELLLLSQIERVTPQQMESDAAFAVGPVYDPASHGTPKLKLRKPEAFIGLGIAAVAVGTTCMILGSALIYTGIGAIVGLPLLIVGIAGIAGGITLIVIGTKKLVQASREARELRYTVAQRKNVQWGIQVGLAPVGQGLRF